MLNGRCPAPLTGPNVSFGSQISSSRSVWVRSWVQQHYSAVKLFWLLCVCFIDLFIATTQESHHLCSFVRLDICHQYAKQRTFKYKSEYNTSTYELHQQDQEMNSKSILIMVALGMGAMIWIVMTMHDVLITQPEEQPPRPQIESTFTFSPSTPSSSTQRTVTTTRDVHFPGGKPPSDPAMYQKQRSTP